MLFRSGGSFRDGFVRGALAGGIVYAGKRVASESFSGAGLLGRGIGAVGASAVRNVSAATPSFSRLSLPIGPLWLDLDTTTREIGARIDPAALVWTAYAIAESELEIDWGETLSSGTPVFLTNNRSLRLAGDTIHSAGVTNAGIVFLADVPAFGPAHARRQAAFAPLRDRRRPEGQGQATPLDPEPHGAGLDHLLGIGL